MTGTETPVLYQITFSHFNEKARWALDYKRVPHRREPLLPGLHERRSMKLGGAGTTPILDCGGGEMVTESAEIVAWAERHGSGPPLYPEDDAKRQRALALEAHFGDEMGPPIRSAVFHAMLPDRKVMVTMSTQGFGAGTRAMVNVFYPLIRRGASKAVDAGDENAERGRRKTVEGFDRLEAELDGGEYLVDDDFTSADLAVAAMFTPLVCPPQFPYQMPDPWPDEWEQFRASLSDRPGYQWVEEMYRRHRGTSAEI
jgi:glutathione S-transferase